MFPLSEAKTVIPLTVQLSDVEPGSTPEFALKPTDDHDRPLLSKENLSEHMEAIQEKGGFKFYVFDTTAEAKAASIMLDADNMQTGMLRDGEGVLMVRDPEMKEIYQINDHRTSKTPELLISADLSEAEAIEVMSTEIYPAALSSNIIEKFCDYPERTLQYMQTKMEYLPGTSVPFVSFAAGDIMDQIKDNLVNISENRDDYLDKIDDAISYISRKGWYGETIGMMAEDIIEKVKEDNPGMFKTDDPEP